MDGLRVAKRIIIEAEIPGIEIYVPGVALTTPSLFNGFRARQLALLSQNLYTLVLD